MGSRLLRRFEHVGCSLDAGSWRARNCGSRKLTNAATDVWTCRRVQYRRSYALLSVGAASLTVWTLHCQGKDQFAGVKPVRPNVARLDEMLARPDQFSAQETYDIARAMAAYDVFAEDAGIQWRFARAAYTLATQPTTPAARKKELILDALRTVTQAKAKHHNSGDLYRWAGTILQAAGDYASTSDYIRNSFLVRDDWLAACTLDPYDASARHLLGRWCYEVAKMPGWKRSIAATLFAEPPRATLQEAKEYFEAAESISPGFWKSNQVWLGMVEDSLGNKGEAAKWALSAVNLPTVSAEDAESQVAAIALLKRVDPTAAAEVERREADRKRR